MRRWIWLSVVLLLAATASLAGEVRLCVEEPAGVERRQWPVTSGIPLAQGALREDGSAALFDEAGGEIPLQTESLARWPDGSVRWLLLDFQIDLAAKQKKAIRLRYGPAVRRAAVEKPLRVTRQADGKVVIEPGPVRLEYSPEMFWPQGVARVTGGSGGQQSQRRATVNCGSDGVFLDKDEDWCFSPLPGKAEIAIEQAGPVRACLRVSGWHERGEKENQRMFRYIARIHAWRGQPCVRVFYTFINDHQDSLMAKVRSLTVHFWSPEFFSNNRPSCLLDGKQARLSVFYAEPRSVANRRRSWA